MLKCGSKQVFFFNLAMFNFDFLSIHVHEYAFAIVIASSTVCCLLFFRVHRKVVSLCVYREDECLRLEGSRERYDSINTLVMCRVTISVPIPIDDHKVLALLRYPVYSSKY